MKPLRFLTFAVVFCALGYGAWRAFQHQEEHEENESAPESEVVVQVAKIKRTTLHRSVTMRGIVEPEHASADRPAALALLAVPSAGLVQQVLCTEGQAVKKGDVLLKLDSRAAEAKVNEAKKSLEFAVQQSARQQALLKVDGTSQKAAQEADAALQKAKLDVASAENDLALLRIESPISGIAIEVEARAGESAEPGKPVITVLDPARLTFRGHVPAADLHEIQTGQPVEYVSAGKPREAQGKVLLVSPRLDEQTGAAEVIASVPPDAGLPSGAWIEARVLTETKDGLAVPLASVVTSEEGSTVFIVEGDTARQHEVKTGLCEGGLVEVISEDIKEGDTVVPVGAYGLPKETKVSFPQAEAVAHEP